MIATIKSKTQSISFNAKSITGGSVMYFKLMDTEDAYSVYEKLKSMGVKCCYVGSNAPRGPYISVYNHTNYTINE